LQSKTPLSGVCSVKPTNELKQKCFSARCFIIDGQSFDAFLPGAQGVHFLEPIGIFTVGALLLAK
jgi:hypothetical protein